VQAPSATSPRNVHCGRMPMGPVTKFACVIPPNFFGQLGRYLGVWPNNWPTGQPPPVHRVRCRPAETGTIGSGHGKGGNPPACKPRQESPGDYAFGACRFDKREAIRARSEGRFTSHGDRHELSNAAWDLNGYGTGIIRMNPSRSALPVANNGHGTPELRPVPLAFPRFGGTPDSV